MKPKAMLTFIGRAAWHALHFYKICVPLKIFPCQRKKRNKMVAPRLSRRTFAILGLAAFIILWFFMLRKASNDDKIEVILPGSELIKILPSKFLDMKPFKVLVTGGAGFIGSHIVEFFDQHVPQCSQVIVLDNLSSGRASNLEFSKKNTKLQDANSRVRLIKGSITDKDTVQSIFHNEPDIAYVFHLAALISVAESMSAPMEYNTVNTLGTITLLKAIQSHGKQVKSFVFSSSAALYGNAGGTEPKKESNCVQCQSPYCQTKYDGEYYCSLIAKDAGFKCVALRYFNVFGERQAINSGYGAVIPKLISAAHKNEKMVLYGGGAQTRDFVYVKDVMVANVYGAVTATKPFEIYNVGYGKCVSIKQLANLVKGLIPESTSQVELLPERPGDVQFSQSDVSKYRAAKWSPSFTFEGALQKTIEYYKQNE